MLGEGGVELVIEASSDLLVFINILKAQDLRSTKSKFQLTFFFAKFEDIQITFYSESLPSRT